MYDRRLKALLRQYRASGQEAYDIEIGMVAKYRSSSMKTVDIHPA